MADQVPGLPGYKRATDPSSAPPKQTVFPKAEGTQGAAPTPAPPPISALPGYQRATPSIDDSLSVKSDSRGDGTWSSLLHDVVNPQPANLSRPQTWRDWVTKTYSPSASDLGTAALDDASFGTADYARSKLTGENLADLRARTADAQAAMGPMGPAVNALTYAVPGAGAAKALETIGAAGKVAGALGRYGAGALEGATANTASSVGHQAGDYIDPLKVAKDAATGAVFGVGGQAAGDAAAAAVRNVSNYVRGSPGRGGEQWDWRDRAAAGDPTLRTDMAAESALRPSDDPAQPALARTQAALGQSVEPGRMADAIYGATGTLGGYLGAPPDLQILGGIGGLTAGGITKAMFGAPVR